MDTSCHGTCNGYERDAFGYSIYHDVVCIHIKGGDSMVVVGRSHEDLRMVIAVR